MSLKSLNDLIKKYEDIRKKLDSAESRFTHNPQQTEDSLFIVDEFIKDLKEVNKIVVHKFE